MDAVNVRQLKNNPSAALRSAANGPVLVLKGDNPEAVILCLDLESTPDSADVLLALATALYKDGVLSLGRAARVARTSVSDLVNHLSRLGIPVVHGTAADTEADLRTLDEWLASS
jgi:predicted HTH domain antitoxin